MSLILDALRKGSRPARSATTADAAHADAVLATLGYGPAPAGRPYASRRMALFAGLLIVAFGGWWLRPALLPLGSGAGPAHAWQVRAAVVRPTPVPGPSSTGRDASTQVAPGTPREPAPVPAQQPARRPSSERPRAPSWRSEFQLAVYYQRAGDFEQALSHYRAVLARNELNVEAHNNLGLLYQQKGLLDESVREFQRAALINQRYPRAHSNLGVTFMRQGKLDLARAEFELASSLDPRDADARVNLALVQKASREPEMARATLLDALVIEPSSAAAHYNLALLYDEAGDTSRALEHYRAFLNHAGVEHASLASDVRARIENLKAK